MSIIFTYGEVRPHEQTPTFCVHIEQYPPQTNISFNPSDINSPTLPLYEQQHWLMHLLQEWNRRKLLSRFELHRHPDRPATTIMSLVGRPVSPQDADQYFEQTAKATEEIVGLNVTANAIDTLAKQMGVALTHPHAPALVRWVAAMRYAASRQ